MKILIFLTALITSVAFAEARYTTLDNGVIIYFEHYPNPTAKFKGTIIFENGSGTDTTEWKENKLFLQCAKKYGALFFYDRNGLGKSPPDLRLSMSNPITGKFIDKKLLELLEKRNIKTPYLLVAHSYGGMYAGYFALKNPNLIKGLLMVDPVPKDFDFSDKIINRNKTATNEAKKKSSAYIYQHYTGPEAELAYQLLGFETTKQEVEKLGNINNHIPVIIISSTGMEKDKSLKQDWYNSQKQWLNGNPKSKIVRVNTGHFIQLEDARVICDQLNVLTQ